MQKDLIHFFKWVQLRVGEIPRLPNWREKELEFVPFIMHCIFIGV